MIYFVGAGSGDKDLITIKGAKLLGAAQSVIYAGSLINKELLELTNNACELFDSSSMNLEEVEDIFVKNEERGFLTVRLHTGDPSIYGAVKEQYDFLERNKIQYEVVPGVSSFSAAAAALKAEYTLPGISQSLIITRYPGRTKAPADEFYKLASVGCSMAIFLSMSLIDSVYETLILTKAYSDATPAAIVYKASWVDEKVIRCHLFDMVAKAKSNNITKTAIIVVGNFLESDYELSKLYDKNFETEYRKALK